MKKYFIFSAIFAGTMMFSACGLGTGGNTIQNGGNYGSGSDIGSAIGGILGQVTGASSNNVSGTWTYVKPAVELQGKNLIAQIGGQLATNEIENKMAPYYEKVGIKKGVMQVTFGQDGTCQGLLSNRKFNGNYTYDSSNQKLNLSLAGHNIALPGNCDVSGNQLHVTFPADALLSAIQKISSGSSNSELKTLGGLLKNYDGVRIGFTFSR